MHIAHCHSSMLWQRIAVGFSIGYFAGHKGHVMNSKATRTHGKSKPSLHLKRTIFILAMVWTVTIALFCIWHIREQHDHVRKIAYSQAKQVIAKDMVYRLWAAKQGGVYVPVTAETLPNPYLADVEHRDVTTTDGQLLTLINPAYMTRQVHELGQEVYGLRGHLTSLDPIRPENAPDAWEAEALRSFLQGVSEVSEITRIEDVEYLRLIMPMNTEASCLKCHGKQGDKLGDLRGGISVAVPLEPLWAPMHQHEFTMILSYALIWLIGLIVTGRAAWNMRRRVHKREQAEAVLWETEKNLRLTLNSIGDGVISTDRTGLVTQLNPVAEKLSGWRSEDALGRPLGEVFKITHPRSRQALADPTESILATGETSGLAGEAILTDTSGTEHRIAHNAAPIIDADGEISGVVLIFQNMSEQIRLQEELLKSRKLEAVAILAGGLAHDFNNLFTGLFGNIQLAMMKLDKAHPAHPRLVLATQSFDVGINLTQQLLTFAKGGHPLLEETDLAQVIHDSIKLGINAENIKIVTTFPKELWQIRGDRSQLSQVFSNLFINSIHAMPEGGTLHIEARNIPDIKLDNAPDLSGNFVEICISDQGSGLTEEEVPKVFDIFYTTKAEGRGLGLSIVHRIVGKHNGHVRLDSKPGVGTTVTVYLPAESSSDKTSATLLANEPENSNVAVSGHMLVMDDEEMIRVLSREMLEACGYQVETAADGDEALAKYISAEKSGKSFDVVFMDLNIAKGMGGKVAIKKLLALDPEAKVIVISGYFSDDVMADFSRYGFKGRLAKPFRIEALQNELTRVMNL